jgi:hypothetical protein
MSKVSREDIVAGEAALRGHYENTRGPRRQTRNHRIAQVAAPIALVCILGSMVPKGGESADPNDARSDSGYSDTGADPDANADPQRVEGVVPEPSVSPSTIGNLYCKLASVTAITNDGRNQTVNAGVTVQGATLGHPDTHIYVPLVQEGLIVPASDANAKTNPDQSVTVTIPVDSGPEDVYGLYLSAPDSNNDGESEKTVCGGFYMDGETANMVAAGQLPKEYSN